METDKNEDKKRLKELEAENLRLKKMYAELQLHSLDEVNDRWVIVTNVVPLTGPIQVSSSKSLQPLKT